MSLKTSSAGDEMDSRAGFRSWVLSRKALSITPAKEMTFSRSSIHRSRRGRKVVYEPEVKKADFSSTSGVFVS